MAEQRDVQALAETVRRSLDTNAAYATPEHLRLIAKSKVALDGLVALLSKQEAVVEAAEALAVIQFSDELVEPRRWAILNESLRKLAALSPPPVASGTEGEDG